MSLDVERQLISALLVNPSSIEEIPLWQADFQNPAFGDFFMAIRNLILRGDVVDSTTLASMFPAREGLLRECEASLTGTPTQTLAGIVLEASRRRVLSNLANKIQGGLSELGSNLDDLAGEVEASLRELGDRRLTGYQPIGRYIDGFRQTLEAAVERKAPVLGLTTGFPGLDQSLNGFAKGELVVIGARPSVGKTALMLNMALAPASLGIPVGVFSLEMSTEELLSRLVASKARVDSRKIRTGQMKFLDLDAVVNAAMAIGESKILINDSPRMSIDQIVTDSRRMVRKEGVKAIFIDYLGLVQHPDKRKDRWEQIAQISATLKSLARELKVPVVVLSQLTRDSHGKKPTLASLRDSGAVEQDADVVLLLWRKGEEDLDAEERQIGLEIGKNRNGPTGELDMKFFPRTLTFREADYA